LGDKLAKPEPNEQYTAPFNQRIPEKLRVEAKKGAIDLGLKLQKFTASSLRLLIYFKENVPGLNNSLKLTDMCYPLICLKAARNDLEKQGYPQESLATIDHVISNVEEFMEAKGNEL
jgi:hypothetical protein